MKDMDRPKNEVPWLELIVMMLALLVIAGLMSVY